MTLRNSAVTTLALLATCSGEPSAPDSTGMRAAQLALAKAPAGELVAWQKAASSDVPNARFLQAAAFDEARRVLVMFGGADVAGSLKANDELWEWSPATGRWRQPDVANGPSERYGAALVYDSKRSRLVLFGGRTSSGTSLDDTWEWNPAVSAWTQLGATTRPPARAQAAMVYEKSTGKILLFGGCRREPGSVGDLVVSMQDTWEYDPSSGQWQSLSVTTAPSARYDAGMLWDAAREKAVLFGGMQADGALKQDMWEWDPAATAWSERAGKGSKPSARYGHAMAFDGTRGKLVLFGGQDQVNITLENDLWEWDATTAAWTQRLTGSEPGLASPRMYASLVADEAGGRLLLVAGAEQERRNAQGFTTVSSHELWEIDPVQLVFTDRTTPSDYPSGRFGHAMAYHPGTGKTYLFGGCNTNNETLGDFWAWDGKTWSRQTAAVSPPARLWSAMAYDPSRKSLILYGGVRLSGPRPMDDTWEWTEASKWTQLEPSASPGGLSGHALLTDTTRNKLLLLQSTSAIWEWDGPTVRWSKRGPIVATATLPSWGQMSYDEGRHKVFLYTGNEYGDSPSELWEWDPSSAGWLERDSRDALGDGVIGIVAYDPRRRRHVVLSADETTSPATVQTWEVESTAPTWYPRPLSLMPGTLHGAAMVFDSGRNVIVFFGGEPIGGGIAANETWEYQVSNLGNGEGCTAATAAACASGNCADGVCCAVAACAEKCTSCNVAGSAGSCAPVAAGTEVPGSCADGLACAINGDCKPRNGLACASDGDCASGHCADGVCCDDACTGACVACNLSGQAGRCQPYQAGSDPETECGQGLGVCRSTCDGVGACVFPGSSVVCDHCVVCDGHGSCATFGRELCSAGGAGGGAVPAGIDGGPGGQRSGTGGVGPGTGARATGGVSGTAGMGGRHAAGLGGIPHHDGAVAGGGTRGVDGALLNTSTDPPATGGRAPGSGGSPGPASSHGGSIVDGARAGGGKGGTTALTRDAPTAEAPAAGCGCYVGAPVHSLGAWWSALLGILLARRRRPRSQ